MELLYKPLFFLSVFTFDIQEHAEIQNKWYVFTNETDDEKSIEERCK